MGKNSPGVRTTRKGFSFAKGSSGRLAGTLPETGTFRRHPAKLASSNSALVTRSRASAPALGSGLFLSKKPASRPAASSRSRGSLNALLSKAAKSPGS